MGDGIFGLLGENGAGKTTLMRVLTTVLAPTSGKVLLDGTLYCEANYEKIQKKIGYLPQEIDLYPSLTVRECLEYMGDLAGIEKRESKKRIDYYLEKTSLADHQKKKMRQLSGGMKRRVGLVQALLHEPDFLIVDEPTTGLDPEERIRIRNLLVDFAEERTVLFSTHVVEDLMATCNQLAVMKKGRFLYTGTMRELLNKARGHVWECCTEDESLARELERKYHISSNSFSVAAGYPQSLNRSNTSVSVSNGSPSSSFSPIIKPHGVNRLSSYKRTQYRSGKNRCASSVL